MALREIIARFGFQIDQRGLQKAQTGIGRVVGQLQGLGVAIGGAVIVRGIKNFITGMVDAGDSLGKTATQLGLSGKELQKWQTAADFAGVAGEALSQSFRVLAKNSLLAQQGSKQAKDAFGALGVAIEDANGNLKPTNELAREAGLALGEMSDRTKAVGLAQQIFGRTGAKLLPLFKDGAEGLDEALAKLEEFGGGLSDELIPLAEDAQDRFTEFGIATESLKSKLAVALLPALNQLVLGLSKAITFLSKTVGGAEGLRSIMIALGLVLAKLAIAKFAGSLLALGRAALIPLLKFALLVLIVDDLIALFEGRGSVIGTFIDKIFGPGSAKAVVDAIKGIGTAFSNLLATGDFEAFDKALDEIFGPIGQDIVSDIVFTFKLIGEAISEAIDGLVESASEAFNAAADVGQSIIDGMVDTVVKGGAAVATALIGVAGGAIVAAAKAIGAKSPSTEAEKQLGEPLAMGVASGAMKAAKAAARLTSGALSAASTLSTPSALSAPARGGAAGGGGGSTNLFKSDISIVVSGGSVSDPSIQKLRQGVRSELRDNRRATLDALTQVVEVPA